jgi:hypothetical protein
MYRTKAEEQVDRWKSYNGCNDVVLKKSFGLCEAADVVGFDIEKKI